jgi:hypothetical protein
MLEKRKHIKNLNGGLKMDKIKYALFPTLIDAFYWYKRGFNTKEEILNKINRIKSPMPEAAAKGVCFEDCVNNVIKTGVAQHPLLKGSFFDKEYQDANFPETKFNFTFKGDLILKIAHKLSACTKMQEYIQANVPTPVGLIKVYGFIDFSYPDKFIDLKTTGSYKNKKYKDYNQHKCYPLLAQLNGRSIKDFMYYVTDFSDTYQEPYKPALKDEFIRDLVEFTEFLEIERNNITDKKIFAL